MSNPSIAAAATPNEVDAIVRDALPESGAEPDLPSERARRTRRASRSAFEQPMTRPRTFTQTASFLGTQRTYTRQTLYRRDESDFRAAAHDEPIDRVRGGYAVPLKDLDEDPYDEAGHVSVFEKPDVIEQFRSDARSSVFRDMLERSRVVNDDEEPIADITEDRRTSMRNIADARKRQSRLRSEILRVMERQQHQVSLLTVDYARCVPARFIDEFLSTLEAKTVCDALVPMLLGTRNPDTLRYHMEEGQLVRVMYHTGCSLEHSETHTLRGHIREHMSPDTNSADYAWYDAHMLASAHTHYDVSARNTLMRHLVFQIPTAAANGPDAQLRQMTDATGYRVHIVAHLVKATQVRNVDAHNELCFRAFHFARYA